MTPDRIADGSGDGTQHVEEEHRQPGPYSLPGHREPGSRQGLANPHAPPRPPGRRKHRAVCLTDIQGVGIGNVRSAYVASQFAATGKPYYSLTSNPAMVHQRTRPPLWHMHRPRGSAAISVC
ncbi:MAG TPA: hypothetical protein VG013_30505 [Gemmataceae bacterium]|nr:hypothetical protein [Gemmataceae bacterium]